MAWVYLFVAGGFEIVWATGLKYSDGFTRLWPSVGTVAAMSVSMCVFGLGRARDSDWDGLCHLDRYWRRGYGYCRHYPVQ